MQEATTLEVIQAITNPLRITAMVNCSLNDFVLRRIWLLFVLCTANLTLQRRFDRVSKSTLRCFVCTRHSEHHLFELHDLLHPSPDFNEEDSLDHQRELQPLERQ